MVEVGRVDPDLEHQQRDRDREHAVAERLDAPRAPSRQLPSVIVLVAETARGH